MTTAARIGRAALAALVLGLATASPAVAADFVVAAPEAASLTDKVTDEAGVLSDSEKAELEDKIAALQQEHHVAVSYTHLTLPTTLHECRSRWSPYH